MTVQRKKGDTTVAEIKTAIKSLADKRAKIGWFSSARYPDGTPVAYVASIHEFGAGPIPARPFLRPAVAEYGPSWVKLLEQGARAVLAGTHTSAQVLEMVALRGAGDVAKKIKAVTSPPLSPTTLLGRYLGGYTGGKELGAAASLLSQGPQNLGNVSTKPLVWTGQMIQSVTGVVE